MMLNLSSVNLLDPIIVSEDKLVLNTDKPREFRNIDRIVDRVIPIERLDGFRRKTSDTQTHVRRFYHPHAIPTQHSNHHAHTSSTSHQHYQTAQHQHSQAIHHLASHNSIKNSSGTVTNSGASTHRDRQFSHPQAPVQREGWAHSQPFPNTSNVYRKHTRDGVSTMSTTIHQLSSPVSQQSNPYELQGQLLNSTRIASPAHHNQPQTPVRSGSLNNSLSTGKEVRDPYSVTKESTSDNVRKKPTFPQILESDVQRLEYIGCGTNASVFTCLYDGSMACEKVLTSENKSEQNHEAAMMLVVDRHPNVLRMYGLCKRSNGETSIILELMQTDLLHKLQGPPAPEMVTQYLQNIDYLLQAARGLRFLIRIGVVHRDVAARNMLISGTCLKVADFGLAKDTQKNRTTADLPKPLSTAPEAIRDLDNPDVWGERSDVWSYGLFIWEVISGGRDPLEEFHNSVPALLTALNHGWLPPKLPEFSDTLWKLMLQCLSLDPTRRPTFDRIIAVLTKCQAETSIVPFREDKSSGNIEPKVVEPVIHSSRIPNRTANVLVDSK